MWLLYITNGPNIDVGRAETLAYAEAAADYNAGSDHTRAKVAEWMGPPWFQRGRDTSALARLAHIKPYFRVRNP